MVTSYREGAVKLDSIERKKNNLNWQEKVKNAGKEK